MKNILKISFLFLFCSTISNCNQEESHDTSFLNEVTAPTNVSAYFNVTQDNTGLVTITPLGEGVTSYIIEFGDGTENSSAIPSGESVQHTYTEGTYEVTIHAMAINGETTSITQTLVVSFNPPENVLVTIENDAAISKLVNVTATADNAVSYTVDFGDGSAIETSNIGETLSHQYTNAGSYTIVVEIMGAAIETVTYTEDFEVTAILQPLNSAATPPAREDSDVVSIFSTAYTNITNPNYFPDWGQAGQGSSWNMFDLSGDEMLQYVNLSYQGIEFGEEIDISAMEYIHLDVWTAEDVTDLEISIIQPGPTEAPVTVALTANQWNSFDIPLSSYTDQGLTLENAFQLKFVGTPWAAGTVFIDNIYFYKNPSTPTGIVGTWKMAPDAGSLGVGPAPGDIGWWNCDAGCVADRACYFDDTYIFAADGTFTNVLGAESWIEGWQGGTDSCGAPVAPHDGTATANYVHNEAAGTITINGTGAYIGLPKANNQGELPNVAVPNSITYDISFIDPNTISVMVEAGAGVFWQYILIREGAATSPLEGTWQMAPEPGALGVGPTLGDTGWWNCDAACVTDRACYYDDQYVFGADGSFTNVLGADSWIEGWQGGTDSCGTPVAPHDGSAVASYIYDAAAGTVTINGTGAFIGLAKANNQGELPNVPVPNSITYNVAFLDSNTINVHIEAGSGVFWQFKLIKN